MAFARRKNNGIGALARKHGQNLHASAILSSETGTIPPTPNLRLFPGCQVNPLFTMDNPASKYGCLELSRGQESDQRTSRSGLLRVRVLRPSDLPQSEQILAAVHFLRWTGGVASSRTLKPTKKRNHTTHNCGLQSPIVKSEF